MEGKTQETAAAKAGMSVRSARKWQSGPLPSETRQERTWRTRPTVSRRKRAAPRAVLAQPSRSRGISTSPVPAATASSG